MDERSVIWLAISICISIITYLSLSQPQKDVVFRRLRIRGRRTSSANTPPRSLSPEKKVPNNSRPKSSEYVHAFPPSQRDVLETLLPTLSDEQKHAMGDLSFDEKTFQDSVMEFTDDYRKCDHSKYNFTGFSCQEIRALGDFPDYAELSGVPLPSPYPEFDIDKAQPRPYRPFRWAYHQTMCKSQHLDSKVPVLTKTQH